MNERQELQNAYNELNFAINQITRRLDIVALECDRQNLPASQVRAVTNWLRKLDTRLAKASLEARYEV